MATTMGSLDLKSLQGLRDDLTQYFWFESNSSATYGAGVHITLSPESTFKTSPTGQNILINTDGISIRNSLLPMMVLDNDSLDFNVVDTNTSTYTNVASFGSVTTIGNTDGTQSYLELDFNSMKMKDSDGDTYFAVEDLRDENGIAKITEYFVGNGSRKNFTVNVPIVNVISVSINDTLTTDYTVEERTIKFTTAPANGAQITIVYNTSSRFTKAYTLGERDDNSGVGIYSIALGYKVTSSQFYSIAEGYYTTASGYYSHAECSLTTASGVSSHAEGSSTTASGSWSHAEGSSTTASGDDSHAEGWSTIAFGNASHAQNYYTNAQKFAQTALGTYNVLDTSSTTTHPSGGSNYGKYAMILGNGTADNARSNALTVDWLGGVQMYLDSNGTSSSVATSGTDMDLFNAIYNLGWYSDVIV